MITKLTAALILVLMATPLFATDLTVSWQAPVDYVEVVSVGEITKPLPEGTLEYTLYNQTNDGEWIVRVQSTTATKVVRPSVGAGKQCYKVTATFTPKVADGNKWGPSKDSNIACQVVGAIGVGPRNAVPPVIKVEISKP